MKISREQLSALTKVFDDDKRIDAAFLLGSAVRNEMRPDSDVDIAILPAPGANLGGIDRATIALELENTLGRTVDVGVLDHGNLVYAKEAYLNGQRIYCRNRFRCELFGASTLGMYAELRESRREVENAYQAR